MKSLAVLVILSVTAAQIMPSAQLTSAGDISSSVVYKEGEWTGNIVCNFYSQLDCSLSMHTNGRRIDLLEKHSNEEMFISCIENSSIALSISNLIHDNIQEYTCLRDNYNEFLYTWLNAYPLIEVEGVEEIGRDVQLTCNSFPGAPLYWILPGSTESNANVTIIDTSNEANASLSAIFKLEQSDDKAEYKCCIKIKSGQSEFPCTSHIFRFTDQFTKNELISTSADYTGTGLFMSCVIRTETTPYFESISWQNCENINNCQSTSSPSNHINSSTNTVNTTLNVAYSSSYLIYKCLYNSITYYTFYVTLGSSTPRLSEIQKEAFYSNDGFAFKLGCSVIATPQPTIQWTKQNIFNASNGFEIINNEDEYTIQTTQISDDEWQTSLVIYPYDVTEHNDIYNCVAETDAGQQSLPFNTYNGPSDLKLSLTYSYRTPSSNQIKATCTFKAFPFPPQYDINVINVKDVNVTTTVSYDEQLMEVTVDSQFLVDDMTNVTVQCSSYNPFEPSAKEFDQVFINTYNYTTIATSTTTGVVIHDLDI